MRCTSSVHVISSGLRGGPGLAGRHRPAHCAGQHVLDCLTDAKLGRVALLALADEPVHVVATFPAGIPPGLPRTRNATVCQFLDHGAVLDRAICVITHGGMGTTVKALDRGVPVCVVPFARDQAEVARRVQVAGCGTRLPPKRLTPARLRAAVLKAATMAHGADRLPPVSPRPAVYRAGRI